MILHSQILNFQTLHNVWILFNMSHLKIVVLLKLIGLVTLFDRKLQVFKNSPNRPFLAIQNVNVARFARNVEWDFLMWFSNTLQWIRSGFNSFVVVVVASSKGLLKCHSKQLPRFEIAIREETMSREKKLRVYKLPLSCYFTHILKDFTKVTLISIFQNLNSVAVCFPVYFAFSDRSPWFSEFEEGIDVVR